MTFLEAKQYLDSFINYENNFKAIDPRTFKLERVRELLRRIDFPKSRTIHVAGTKGKGSTCAFIASILSVEGYKVGLYTSPHLSDFKERIRILKPFASSKNSGDAFAGKITERDFARTLTQMKPAIEQVNRALTPERLSFFEVLTVLAVYYFHLKEVDFIILETGLGGRLDATNVFKSHICVLTPISLEHTQQLGSTIKAIAQEKAAIIKNKNQIAVIAPQEPSAERVIKNRLEEYDVPSVWVGRDIFYDMSFPNAFPSCRGLPLVVVGNLNQNKFRPPTETFGGDNRGINFKQFFRLKTSNNDYLRLKTKLLGEHQLINAAVAVGVVEALSSFGFKISKSAVVRGIANAQWPGRFEIFQRKPFVILDGAHNPASAHALAKTVQKIFPGKKVVLILGISEDKDKNGIAKELNRIAKKIIFTQARHPRAWAFKDEESENLFHGKETVRIEKIQEALKEALRSAKKDDIILICGSLFVVGEARECLWHKAKSVEHRGL